MNYDAESAVRFLEEHPNYSVIFHVGRWNKGIVSPIAFISDMTCIFEWELEKIFTRKKWNL